MIQAGAINILAQRSGQNVILSVIDSGPGIPEAIKVRIFEAFFTTKNVGEGTGLGLSISKTIVERCGGQISVQSKLGQGTTFQIQFPIAQELA